MVCQFCLRPVRHTNLRRVCGACRRNGRGVCLFCGLPFHESHACALNVPKCVNCHQPYWVQRLALPLDAGRRTNDVERRRGLCGKCKRQGFALCQKTGCSGLAKDAGKFVFCDQHHPLPASSLWRKGIIPLGGPPFLNTRSWRSWGVELECYLDRGARVPEGWRPPTGWGKGTDGSIRPPYETQAAEFRSPPFFGDRGLSQMVKDISAIKRAGWGGVNKSTGYHLHVDMSEADEEDHRAVFRFAKHFEDQVFELVAPSRRDNTYAKRLGARLNVRDRYRWTNFCSLREFGTVEIRLHQGTMHPIRVRMWTCLMLKFMEAALRQGRQRVLPKKSLLDVLSLTPRERVYWTARKNRFIRDQRRREQQAQSTPQTTQTGV